MASPNMRPGRKATKVAKRKKSGMKRDYLNRAIDKVPSRGKNAGR